MKRPAPRPRKMSAPPANPRIAADKAKKGQNTARSKMEKAVGESPFVNASGLGSYENLRQARTNTRAGAQERKKLIQTAQRTRKGK